MRWIVKYRARTQQKPPSIGPFKLFVMLASFTFLLFVALGTGFMLQSRLSDKPALTMKGITSGVSSEFFMDMLAMEARYLPDEEREYTFSARNVANFLLRLLIHINPVDPKSLLASELPGMSGIEPVLLRASSQDPAGPAPQDYSPQPDTAADTDQVAPPETGGGAADDPATDAKDWNAELLGETVNNQHVPGTAVVKKENEHVPASLSQTKKVFIYHSHGRESFLPELEGVTSPNEANDPEINVRLLGKRLAAKLTELGVGALSSDVDYQTVIKDHNWNFSYQYSLETVKEAFAANPDLEYFIDIHRDSQGREITTKEFDGVPYARVAFVIGQENPNWEKNEAFAAKIHERLEKLYPGLSRGSWGKDSRSGHGEYNQSFSPNSILIEVGGVENTLEETYRTIDVLARVIAEIVMEAEMVNLPAEEDKEAV